MYASSRAQVGGILRDVHGTGRRHCEAAACPFQNVCDDLKAVAATLLFKTSKKQHLANYRSVSLNSVPEKVVDQILEAISCLRTSGLTNLIAVCGEANWQLWMWGRQWMLCIFILASPLVRGPIVSFIRKLVRKRPDKWLKRWMENWLDCQGSESYDQ